MGCVGSNRIRRFAKRRGSGWFGSGGLRVWHVGTGHPDPDPIRPAGCDPTRERKSPEFFYQTPLIVGVVCVVRAWARQIVVGHQCWRHGAVGDTWERGAAYRHRYVEGAGIGF